MIPTQKGYVCAVTLDGGHWCHTKWWNLWGRWCFAALFTIGSLLSIVTFARCLVRYWKHQGRPKYYIATGYDEDERYRYGTRFDNPVYNEYPTRPTIAPQASIKPQGQPSAPSPTYSGERSSRPKHARSGSLSRKSIGCQAWPKRKASSLPPHKSRTVVD